MSTLLRTLVQVVEEIVLQQHCHPTYEIVTASFCDRIKNYNLQGIVSSDSNVRTFLDWLFRMNQKINSFCMCYASTRSFYCILDLRKELFRSLMLTERETLATYKKLAVPTDPNEIDIEMDEIESKNLTQISIPPLDSYESYGLGPIEHHQIFIRMFAHCSRELTIDNQEIYGYLVDYMSELKSSLFKPELISAFQQYLCHKLNVHSLVDVGVSINFQNYRAWELDWSNLAEVANNKRKMLWQVQKFEFEKLQRSIQRDESQTQSAKKRKQDLYAIEEQDNDQATIIKMSDILVNTTKTEVSQFVEIIRLKVNSVHSPSYSKVQDAVKSLLNKGFTQDMVVLSLTDYAMLHLGGSKYREKRFYVNQETIENAKTLELPNVSNVITDTNFTNESFTSSSNANVMNIVETSEEQITKNIIERETYNSSSFESRLAMETKSDDTKFVKTVKSSEIESIITALNISLRNNCNYETGRTGELIVYRYLLLIYPNAIVEWINEHEESKASYDIIVKVPLGANKTFKTIYVEVKSSKYLDKNVFPISLWEWDFLHNVPKVEYHIYRVLGLNNDCRGAYLNVIYDTIEAIKEGSCKLCIASTM